MNVYLNEISGLWNAIDTMYFSKRSWTREREQHIMELCDQCYDKHGLLVSAIPDELMDLMNKLFKWAPKHITMGRFLDFSFTIEGLHRGAQDDLDAHAMRMNNRIIRSSTRLASFGSEKSAWYQGKILTTEEALEAIGQHIPHHIEVNGIEYIRTTGGYVAIPYADSQDVKRGLYPLSIPSNCTFRVDCTQFAHIVKERDANSHAHPELRECIELAMAKVQQNIPQLTREFYYSVKN